MNFNNIARAGWRALVLWLAACGVVFAQTNNIESFDVSQQGGKVVVRITTREALKAPPPSFTVANPARIAFDFGGTGNALGRSSQDISQGELRSMNVVQGADKTRLVLNLRRPSSATSCATGRRTKWRSTGAAWWSRCKARPRRRETRSRISRKGATTPSTPSATSISGAAARAKAGS